jgi:hypothetical protein
VGRGACAGARLLGRAHGVGRPDEGAGRGVERGNGPRAAGPRAWGMAGGVRLGCQEGARPSRPRGGGGFVGRASAMGWGKGRPGFSFFPIFFIS